MVFHENIFPFLQYETYSTALIEQYLSFFNYDYPQISIPHVTSPNCSISSPKNSWKSSHDHHFSSLSTSQPTKRRSNRHTKPHVWTKIVYVILYFLPIALKLSIMQGILFLIAFLTTFFNTVHPFPCLCISHSRTYHL